MSEAARRGAPGVLVPALVALAAFIVFIGLGTWQLERKAWKEGLIGALNERLSADPTPLPPPARWDTLDQDHDEFRRVSFSAVLAADEALLYATGSTFRPDVRPRLLVFTPATLADGARVVVNRGFVPRDSRQRRPIRRQPARSRSSARCAGRSRVDGSRPVTTRRIICGFVRDPRAIASAKGWGTQRRFT